MTKTIKYENSKAIVSIIIISFAFNFEAIFGLETLIQDGFARYYHAINGYTYQSSIYGNAFSFIKELNKALMLINIYLARFFYLIAFSVPLSFLIFYLNRKYFKFSFSSALFGSAMVSILPFQTQIPSFIDGSYPLIGLTFLFATVILSLEYLKSKRLFTLLLAVILWYLSNYHFRIAELNLFIFPAIILLILINNSGSKTNKGILITAFTAIISYRFYIVCYSILYETGRGAGTPVALTLEDIIQRLGKVISWSSLIPKLLITNSHLFVITTAALFIVCIVAGLYSLFTSRKLMIYREYFKAFLFYSLFSFLTSLPFITLSPWIAPRHLFVAQIGFVVVFILFLDLIIRHVLRNSKNVFKVSATILLTLTLLTGIHRHYNLKRVNNELNQEYHIICNLIGEINDFASNSQIVVTGHQAGTGEHFIWSSGLYSFCLKKQGIVGILGNEYSFYDPFILAHRDYFYKMGGLDLNLPIFIFRKQGDAFIRPNYLLRWIEKENEKSVWAIYTVDSTTNMLREFLTGKGIDEYILGLKTNYLSPDEILWSGYDPERYWTKIDTTSLYLNHQSTQSNTSFAEPMNHLQKKNVIN